MLVAHLRGAYDPTENTNLSPLLFYPSLGLSVLDAIKITRASGRRRGRSIVEILGDEKILEDLQVDVVAAQALHVRVSQWATRARNDHVMMFVEYMMRDSGLLDRVLSHPQALEKLALLEKFFSVGREVSASVPDAKVIDLIEHLDTLQTHSIAIKHGLRGASAGRVRLMTAHRSKGLEFHYVYILGVVDGHWGNKRRRELLPLLPEVYRLFQSIETPDGADAVQDKNADERRLFYVALTRARKHVTITYHASGTDGREKLPSQFIGEINQELVEMETPDVNADSVMEKSIVFQPAIVRQLSGDEKIAQLRAFAREQFLSQGLSVSALNNYLKSPWLYFFRNLVRIPSAQNKNQSLGSAVHDALQGFFDVAKEDEVPPVEFLLEAFETSVQGRFLSAADRRDILEKGRDMLTRWYEAQDGVWTTTTENEVSIRGVYLADTHESELPIMLTGALDKLEFEEGNERDVRVIDYKTGKPKSEKHVRGETKDSTGDYYRQLVFYKLLLRYYKEGRYRMSAGVLEFIEPTVAGKYSTLSFVISDEEVDDLEEEIKKAAQEIVSLDFWDSEPDPEYCEEYLDLIEKIRG
jgi:DNA helicase-2/ATP-dependent DNA helicase PcrA